MSWWCKGTAQIARIQDSGIVDEGSPTAGEKMEWDGIEAGTSLMAGKTAATKVVAGGALKAGTYWLAPKISYALATGLGLGLFSGVALATAGFMVVSYLEDRRSQTEPLVEVPDRLQPFLNQ